MHSSPTKSNSADGHSNSQLAHPFDSQSGGLAMAPPAFQLKTSDSTSPGPPQKAQPTANNTGLPDNLKSGIESMSGIGMDDVKVHYNSSKPAQVQAHAYAQGTDIHVASGQEEHLPHEAWHVVQQKQGRVQPTMQLKAENSESVGINDSQELETEADTMGIKALAAGEEAGTTIQQALPPTSPVQLKAGEGAPIQRILRNTATGQMVSTSDKTTVIDATHAAITIAATKDDSTGGHAEIYIEAIENGTPVEYSVDMFGVNDAKALVRIKTYAEGGLNSRGKGGSTTYSVTPGQVDAVLVDAIDLKCKGELGSLKYSYYGSKFKNVLGGPVTYMNCADFAEHVLNAGGITAPSGGLFSIPKKLAKG